MEEHFELRVGFYGTQRVVVCACGEHEVVPDREEAARWLDEHFRAVGRSEA